MSDPYAYLAVILVCVLLSAVFSGSETALLRLRADELEKDTKSAKGPSVLAARDLLRSTSRLLVTLLVGNNVVNILATATASALAIQYFGEDRGIVISTTAMTIIVLIFAEILPKAVGARNPKLISYAVAIPLYLLHKLLFPLHVLFDKVIDPVVKWIAGGKDAEHLDTSEEILRLAKKTRIEREDESSPLKIIAGTARAADMTVSEILVPRTEVFAFPVNTSPQKLLDEALEEKYTRIPIYDGGLDNIVGVVHLKDLARLARTPNGDLKSIMKPVIRVPERKPILRLLADMQRAFIHLAVVKDEFGVTQGIVTQEDILEEIVGEIRDEHDRDELLTIIERPDGSFDAIGRTLVLDFNRETHWNIPAPPGETLSGLVFNELGRSPKPGDTVFFKEHEFEVLDCSGSRITRVRVYPKKKRADGPLPS